MTDVRVGDCGHPLTGQQRKWCSPDCQKQAAHDARLQKIFALTAIDYAAILAHQGGACAICRKPPRAGKRLAVDHDHKTGFVRGALCNYCNLRIVARLRDAAIMRAAADYLDNPPARAALGRDVVAPGRPPKKRTRRPPNRKKTA